MRTLSLKLKAFRTFTEHNRKTFISLWLTARNSR